ncbi:hypothetical protein BO86DRAFT_385129 [Aspergillus japonicus CBS 114.51]|uniref:Alpha/beta-hydrolase n=1 Tax=Aspergillus japonicus CBS 114.51 TaxID=1448312 RepID=A0A8T8XGJ9_ASPJA|nr:hypothetical protein BO86DRAFT_385129 [Aspergillus japonicus CBS 114.51]RAH87141.1 hypothetical protein BO86DRAFT_385129 [Aspergillus japonicus CBS 114.51]
MAVHMQSAGGHTSSDSEDPSLRDPTREDEAYDMVGVSISRTQSRMKARRTPAAEKSRAMDQHGGYFDAIPDSPESDSGLFASHLTQEPEQFQSSQPPPAQPHPSRGAKEKLKDHRSSFTRSLLKSSLPLRPRAWSGDSITNLRLKKFLPDSWTKRIASQPSPRTVKPGPGAAQRRSLTDESTDEPISDLKPLAGATAARHSYARRPSAAVSGKAPPMLRRSSSDQSLYLRRSSTASSLEQRPRYEHIHSQVNSRFKAIKDSLQDSSSRLLSMPTLHLQDLRSDWGYRPFLSEVSHPRKVHEEDPIAPHEQPPADPTGPSSLPPPPRTRSPRSSSSAQHPRLADAMDDLTGDVVILGGYRGSVLRSAKPPQRQLWVPMKVGLNLRKVDLEVGLNPEDEERMEETIIPSGVLSHVGPVDICRRLMKRLQKCSNSTRGDLRVWDYGYDWRLSPHLLAKRLIKFLEGLPSNAPGTPREKRGAYVIAHSLGGLITRHAVNQRPELFAGVLYAGVPQHCVNILGPLRNGDDVLLSSRVLTAQVNFTFRTSFALLPEDGHCFIDQRTKEEYRVDFFDAQTWDEYRLSPCINPALPVSSPSRGFVKDNLPLISKRLSTVLNSKESLPSSGSASSSDGGEASNSYKPAPNQSANPPTAAAMKPAPVAPPAVEGAIGPNSNLRGSSNTKVTTAVTIPRATAITYLERTLAEVRRFKEELVFDAAHQANNRYPPFAVLYGKSVPTLYGARVASREAIKRQDAYDDLAFAAGDGVCLASAAMLPSGYRVIKGGLVKSERGHVGLLGDLEGVGQCLQALIRGRREGVGLGQSPASSS